MVEGDVMKNSRKIIRITSFLLLIILGVLFTILILFKEQMKVSTFNYIDSVVQLDINRMFAHGAYIYYQDEDALYEYDYELNEIRRISPNLDNIVTFYFDSFGNLKVLVESSSQIGVIGSEIRMTQYDITNVEVPSEDFQIIINSHNESLPFIFSYEEAVYNVSSTMNNSKYPILGSQSNFDTYDILFQDKNNIIFVTNSDITRYISVNTDFGSNYYGNYSNNKLLVQDNEVGIYIYDTDELGEDGETNFIDLDISINAIDAFMFDGNNYYVNVYDGNTNNSFMSIYDYDYNLIAQIENSGKVFMTENFIYQTQYDNEGNILWQKLIDINNIFSSEINIFNLFDD